MKANIIGMIYANIFDNHKFDIDDFEPIQYLINNLHSVLAIINNNAVLKQNRDEYFVVFKFKGFTTQDIHFTKQMKVHIKEVDIGLEKIT